MTEIYDEAGDLFFAPRQLGATGPAYPEIFAVDYRDTGGPIQLEAGEPPVRTLEDDTFTTQLGILMMAGLQVKL